MTQPMTIQAQRRSKTAILALFLAATSVAASLNYNCNSSANPTLDNGEAIWKIGEESTLCVYFVPYQVKTAFKVTVDKNAALSLRNGYEVFKNGDADLALQLTSSSRVSQQLVS